MRPPVKFIHAASVTLIVGALLSAGVAFLTRDPRSGEEAPGITRDQQQIGAADVLAMVAPRSDAQPQPSSSTELPSPSAPSSSPQLPRPVERSGLIELPSPVEQSLSPDLPGTVERSASTDLPGTVERSASTDLPGAVERSEVPRPLERSVSPDLPRAVESNPVVDASYRFVARRQGQILFLEGYVPDERTGQQLMAFARERFFDVAVVNQARLHDGAPTGFSAGARFALEQLSFLASGEALLRNKSIWLSGEALYRQTGEQTCAKIASLAPHGWTGTASIKWRQEEADENAFPACQSRHMP
jgi:hypothetical protein